MTEEERGVGEGTDRELTVIVVPDGGKQTRTFRISYRQLRWVWIGAGTTLAVGLVTIASWGYLASRAREATLLEREVARLQAREGEVEALAQSLEEVEQAYEGIRSLFGADASAGAGELWLPPPTGPAPAERSRAGAAEGDVPSAWPLTEAGFVTQALLAEVASEHPGIDVAVPSGSYVRAAASGTVSEAGTDRIYGNYLVLDHGMDYRTRYAHVSVILAAEGEVVRRNEVIALSGSTGSSTAPHLHFEILHGGVPIDPLTLVTPP